MGSNPILSMGRIKQVDTGSLASLRGCGLMSVSSVGRAFV